MPNTVTKFTKLQGLPLSNYRLVTLTKYPCDSQISRSDSRNVHGPAGSGVFVTYENGGIVVSCEGSRGYVTYLQSPGNWR